MTDELAARRARYPSASHVVTAAMLHAEWWHGFRFGAFVAGAGAIIGVTCGLLVGWLI